MSVETPVLFAGGRLFGILTEPERRDPSRPCVVVLNAGLIPRPGPGRMSVVLARALSAAGLAVFRFDLSGIGDSDPRPSSLPIAESIVADVREALDQLASGPAPFGRFVLMGLCAGATASHYAAVADPRVVGAVMLDGYLFPTARSRALEAAERLMHPVALAHSLVRRMRAPGGAPAAAPDPDDGFLPHWPTHEQAERDLAALASRGVELLYVFSGEWGPYRYEGQMRDAFAGVELHGRIAERRIACADHLYFTRPERDEMLEAVTSWLATRFPREGLSSR